MGGYSTGATEELLRQVAWDYRQLVREKSELVEQSQALHERISELERQVQALTEHRDRLESRQDLAAATLTAAQRAAHDARESARRECELMLKAARRRAEEIEQTMEKALAVRSGEVQALEEAQQRLLAELRHVFSAALESIEHAGSSALNDLAGELGEAVSRAADTRLSAVAAQPPAEADVSV